ncbi:MAG: anaerobic ribonucleoside-triphosphate reductase activating protein [Clostridia bacterium]|nr:anaerobic ribonucleoside-triphosphate reductase activating protein [Clostridia bacterium]MBR4359956.1 anaerobic ribonucleoside-triphosphate reductase activating protein [Clostridia bacterium]
MKIRLAGIVDDSIVDGPGLRFSVFTQGCSHHCPGCHNPETHDPMGGHEEDTEALVARMKKNPLLSGITLSGGDPMEQGAPCAELAKAAHGLGLNVWTYTGYTWEQLLQENDPDKMALLRETDVLVDGPFLLNQRSLELNFCGSKNQRLIDVPASLRSGSVTLWTPPVW